VIIFASAIFLQLENLSDRLKDNTESSAKSNDRSDSKGKVNDPKLGRKTFDESWRGIQLSLKTILDGEPLPWEKFIKSYESIANISSFKSEVGLDELRYSC
jgi:hypothetical protein